MCAVGPKLSNLLKIDGFTYIVVGSFWYTFIMFQLLIDQSCCPVSFAKVQKDFAATMLLSRGGGGTLGISGGGGAAGTLGPLT